MACSGQHGSAAADTARVLDTGLTERGENPYAR
jgi:hypothetical protein